MLITDGFNLNDIIDISCNVELRIARLVRISILIIDEHLLLIKILRCLPFFRLCYLIPPTLLSLFCAEAAEETKQDNNAALNNRMFKFETCKIIFKDKGFVPPEG